MGLPKLNTVDGAVDLNLYGNLSYPLLGSAGSVTLSGDVVSITTVDISGLTTGEVTTAANVLLPSAATSVKLGSLPASVTLAKAVTVEAHGTDALGAMSMSAPKATAVTIKAPSITGQVTLVANLANVTLLATSSAVTTTIHAGTVVADALTTLPVSTATISTTSLSVAALKNVNGALTLTTATTAVFPALESLTKVFTGAAVTSFSAPKLVTTAGGNIDIKTVAAGGGTIAVKSIATIAEVVDAATIAGITVTAQAANLNFATFVKLADLAYSSSVIAGTLSASMVSLTTITLGSDSKLTSLTVSGSTAMTTLSTAGVILNTNVRNNTKLATLSFGHTHLDGANATTVDIINNDKIVALDMSSLGKVKEVEITGNASLTTFIAPSTANKAEPTVTIIVTFTGNDITGTYSPTIAASETTAEVPYTASSAAITSWKGFIDGYSSTQTVTFNLDIDRLLLGASTDGKYDDGKFSAGTAHSSNIDTAAELAKF
jgi:hypothetical protein